MKTRTKTVVVVEIAIVLCLVFLVALPTVTAASEIYEPGPLDVFGNANEDDTIDMRDTTYIKLVIFGKKPKTDFADANNDGKVSMLDVGQTKLIILGKEKKLTYIDILGDAETVNKPIRRLANIGCFGSQVTRMFGAMDILLPIVGGDYTKKYPTFYPEISKWQIVGSKPDEIDFEEILSLKPDAVQTNIEANWALPKGPQDKRTFKEKLPGIPIICVNMREPYVISRSLRTYGYILDKEEEAEEFIDWYEGYFNTIKSRTEGLSEDERPRVYIERTKPYVTKGASDRFGQAISLAGGNNIAANLPLTGHSINVDPEWVIEQNPEIIIRGVICQAGSCSYETDDPSEMASWRQEILDRPELANVDAVKNKRVYALDNNWMSGGGNTIIGTAYMAKLFHPDLFNDIDPQTVHQEYVDKNHIDFNVREHGVFFYPPLE